MKEYIIKTISGEPDENDWAAANVAGMNVDPWKITDFHFDSFARILRGDDAIYVLMESNEMPVVASFTEKNSPVCLESCMEFFFCPNIDTGWYFNFELNALGALNFSFCKSRSERVRCTEETSVFDIRPQLKADGWSISFKIPFDFIKKYAGDFTTQMRGNFQKCGSNTGHKHYGVWNAIETPTPDFHRPEYFGSLRFE